MRLYLLTASVALGIILPINYSLADDSKINASQCVNPDPYGTLGDNVKTQRYVAYYTCLTQKLIRDAFSNSDLFWGKSGTVTGNEALLVGSLTSQQLSANQTNQAVASTLYSANTETVISQNAQLIPQNSSQAVARAPMYSISSILGKNGISPSTSQNSDLNNANNFIQVVSGQNIPLSPLPASWLNSDDSAIQSYLNQVATYAATQSVGTGVLNSLLAERIQQKLNPEVKDGALADPNVSVTLDDPITGKPLLKNAELLDPQKKMSPLELEQYLATRRVINNKWYDHLQDETPAQLSRENLAILAEIRYEMFQQRMQMEMLNATLATMQLEMQQAVNRLVLSQTENQAARRHTATSGPDDSDD